MAAIAAVKAVKVRAGVPRGMLDAFCRARPETICVFQPRFPEIIMLPLPSSAPVAVGGGGVGRGGCLSSRRGGAAAQDRLAALTANGGGGGGGGSGPASPPGKGKNAKKVSGPRPPRAARGVLRLAPARPAPRLSLAPAPVSQPAELPPAAGARRRG
jgi:hypothetical protein